MIHYSPTLFVTNCCLVVYPSESNMALRLFHSEIAYINKPSVAIRVPLARSLSTVEIIFSLMLCQQVSLQDAFGKVVHSFPTFLRCGTLLAAFAATARCKTHIQEVRSSSSLSPILIQVFGLYRVMIQGLECAELW